MKKQKETLVFEKEMAAGLLQERKQKGPSCTKWPSWTKWPMDQKKGSKLDKKTSWRLRIRCRNFWYREMEVTVNTGEAKYGAMDEFGEQKKSQRLRKLLCVPTRDLLIKVRLSFQGGDQSRVIRIVCYLRGACVQVEEPRKTLRVTNGRCAVSS